jgi:hypothetical protein
MISYSKFSVLLNELFLKPLKLFSFGFDPHYSTSINDLTIKFDLENNGEPLSSTNGACLLWHEEPLNSNLPNFECMSFYNYQRLHFLSKYSFGNEIKINIFANSEKSTLKKEWLKKNHHFDWYFFLHGFVSLDWFRDSKYLTFETVQIDKVFICLNHLITDNRSYRLTLISKLKELDLLKFGHISAPLLNKDILKKELFSKYTKLSIKAKKHILKNLHNDAKPFYLDNVSNYKHASADIAFPFSFSALWHVVTETNFYEDKIHLTEKIFKPIVCKRPFILVSATENLNYLKSYGFKTFDSWIDESYDNVSDPDLRIDLICKEIEKLSKLSPKKLKDMHLEMQEILEFNYQHFFGKFKEIIVDELIDNFKKILFLYNKDKSERFRLPEHHLNFEKIRKILLS